MIFYGSKQNGNLGALFIITESTSLHFAILSPEDSVNDVFLGGLFKVGRN